jgi:hypothetical protein
MVNGVPALPLAAPFPTARSTAPVSTDWFDLVPLVVVDEALPTPHWPRIAVVARYDDGVAVDDAFTWTESGIATRFSLDNDDIAESLWDTCADHDARVAVLIIDRDDDEAALNLLYDTEAEPWFVPFGDEHLIAELVAENAGPAPEPALIAAVG